MPLLPRLTSLTRNLLRRHDVEQQLEDEVSSFIELRTRENMKKGMDERDARRAGMIEVGGAARWRCSPATCPRGARPVSIP